MVKEHLDTAMDGDWEEVSDTSFLALPFEMSQNFEAFTTRVGQLLQPHTDQLIVCSHQV